VDQSQPSIRATIALDPADLHNAVIVDLDRAPQGPNGKLVEVVGRTWAGRPAQEGCQRARVALLPIEIVSGYRPAPTRNAAEFCDNTHRRTDIDLGQGHFAGHLPQGGPRQARVLADSVRSA
jgi:hypothetical protein